MNSMRSKRRNSRLCVLGLALCLTMLLGIFATSCNGGAPEATEGTSTEGQDSTTPKVISVLRLKEDLEAGEKITSAKFEAVEMDSSKVWIGAITDPEAVIGKYAQKNMVVGDFFLPHDIGDDKPKVKPQKVVLDEKDWGIEDMGFVVITEFLNANTGEDIASKIQKVIDTHPQSVIYFPDGEYLIGSPIKTSSNGGLAVSLKLSDNAVIKATDDWAKSSGAMIRLGGTKQLNSINIIGSNYYIEGGIIDGSGRADGVAVDHGRETSVRDVTIVNTNVGLHVKDGANGGSSDADIENIRIYGNGSPSSVGLLIEGWDNTFSNMRIANVQTGVRVTTAANLIRDIQVTYISNPKSAPLQSTSVGFEDLGDRNWYDNCSSIDFATAFKIEASRSFLTSCVAKWTQAQKDSAKQVAIYTSHTWRSLARSVAAYFTAPAARCEYLVAAADGRGNIVDPIFDTAAVNGKTYEGYLEGKVFPIK